MLKVAIVGSGNIGRFHARAFNSLPDVKVACVISRTHTSKSSLPEDFSGAVPVGSFREAWESFAPDLLVIAVPVAETYRALKSASGFDWVILVEKPPALEVSDVDELVEATPEKEGKNIFVALNRRHFSTVRTLVSEVQSVQSPVQIEVRDQESPSGARSNGQPAEVVDRWHQANSIHLIDLLLFVGRGRAWVEGVSQKRHTGSTVLEASISFSSGDSARYTAFIDRPGPWGVAVSAADFFCELQPLEVAKWDRGVHERYDQEVVTREGMKAGFLEQAQELVNLINGETATSLVSLRESVDSMKLADAIFQGYSWR